MRARLIALVFASVLPMLLFAVIMVVLFEGQQRALLDRSLRDTARALTVAVDHELRSSLSTLRALATSTDLDAGDLRSFHQDAQRVLPARGGWTTITLVDRSGQQVINLRRPYGVSLPDSRTLPVVRQVLDTKQSAISDLFVEPVLGRPIVVLAVPVLRHGQLKYVLAAGLDPTALSRLLSERALRPEWTATIIDRQGVIVARTRDIEQWLGKGGAPEFVRLARGAPEGAFRGVTEDGVLVNAAYSRSSLSGWTVGLGAPGVLVDAPVRRSLWVVTTGGLALLLLGGGLAIWFGRQIADEIKSLSESARALGRGQMPAPRRQSTIAEVAAVEREMADAGRARAEAVAALVRTEDALRESEERTRLIVTHALDAVITMDVEGRITSWNPQASAMFGWSWEEISGRLLSATIIPPAYREAHARGLAHFRETGQGPVLDRRIELTALHRNGTEFPVELAITAMRVGGATVFSAFLRDITERTRAEQIRRESEASFRLLFASNPLPMWVYDVATMAFLEVNAAAVTHYGYSRDEFLGMRITDIRPPEDVPALERAVAASATAAEGGVRRHEGVWRHRLKDGRIRNVDIMSHAIDFAGRRAALVVAIDVTNLKQTQALLAKSAERLEILHAIDRAVIAAEAPEAIAEAALRRLRDVLGLPRAIVSLFDLAAGEAEWLAAAGRHRVHVGPGVRFPLELMGDVDALRRGELQVIDVAALPRSREAEALLASGVSTYMVVPMLAGGELIGGLSLGGAPSEFRPEQVSIAREVAAQLAIAVEQARLHERVKRQALELELRVRERTVELNVANEHLEREITERQAAQARADRANQAKSEYLSRMSHELRTPLNSIIGFTELLLVGGREQLSARQRTALEKVLGSGRHLLGLINDVLDLSKIEAGRMEVRPETIALRALAHECLTIVEAQASAKALALEITEAEPGLIIQQDRGKLKQVLVNLVSNAVKFTAHGSVELRLGPVDGDAIAISVADTGIGIAPDDQERIFEPFQQADSSQASAAGGTGLGLAIARRLVALMGGTLRVESALGHGTTFTLRLSRHYAPPSVPSPETVSNGRSRD